MNFIPTFYPKVKYLIIFARLLRICKQSDAAEFSFPQGVGGITAGKALVVLDFKLPNNWLAWLAPPLERLLTRPFGGTS